MFNRDLPKNITSIAQHPGVIPNVATGCWDWTRAKTHGYGQLSYDGKRWKAHRFAWVLANGAVPSGKWILHKCHNRACCNPDHLYAGTPKDNVRDMFEAGRAPDWRGENATKAILTEKEVHQIRRAASMKIDHETLARWYGMKRSGIRRVIYRLSWTHI